MVETIKQRSVRRGGQGKRIAKFKSIIQLAFQMLISLMAKLAHSFPFSKILPCKNTEIYRKIR